MALAQEGKRKDVESWAEGRWGSPLAGGSGWGKRGSGKLECPAGGSGGRGAPSDRQTVPVGMRQSLDTEARLGWGLHSTVEASWDSRPRSVSLEECG